MDRFYGLGSVEPLGAREVGVIASTNQLGRDGHIVEPTGIDLADYRKVPIVLFNHDSASPVGVTSAIGVRDGALAARIEFAPEGMSPLADQCCSLVKAGVLRGISIGFDPIEFEPLDPARPRGGQHITRSTLLELSCVAVPADTGAMVVERAASRATHFDFGALRAVPRAAVERSLARVLRRRDGLIMSPTLQTWCLVNARERDREERFGRAARQRDLERLRERGRQLGIGN